MDSICATPAHFGALIALQAPGCSQIESPLLLAGIVSVECGADPWFAPALSQAEGMVLAGHQSEIGTA